ncbi:Cofilin/tropomyosin family protein, putative [Candida maltosa Xu316]|uniref:Cofilin/tropomyosin family protein, putative n=1 Tax=Candida maltosa (strain Xu316) TaxID=1245528 RepID=M3HER0_CANMX|nr:Cofilin/tropomyosin family protein, putative [Candida maltosa Xu316]
MSSTLYSFSSETLTKLKKFRFESARKDTPQAVITIDKKSYEIKADDEVIDSIDELIEELPDTAPRYVVLSYPFKLKDGRMAYPLVMLYWIPPTSSQESRMLYAGAVEQFRDKAGVSLIKLEEEEDFEELQDQLV